MSAHLAALHAQAFDEPWSAQEFEDLIAAGAQALEEDAGFILIRAAADEAEILTVAVRPASRRGGLGRRLLDRALESAANQGVMRLFLEVADDNIAAIALYRAAGFTQIAVRHRYYRLADGGLRDALIFERTLNSP